jgi:hypothetical protein
MEDALTAELKALLNKNNRENMSNTPDFILATYMISCLEAFETANKARENWYGYGLGISGPYKFVLPEGMIDEDS